MVSSVQSRLLVVSLMLPWKQCHCWSDWRWPFFVPRMNIVERLLFLCFSPRLCPVLGFVSTGSVSSSSTLQIFGDASHLWRLLHRLSFPLCPFLWLRRVQDSTSTRVLEGARGHRTQGSPLLGTQSYETFSRVPSAENPELRNDLKGPLCWEPKATKHSVLKARSTSEHIHAYFA